MNIFLILKKRHVARVGFIIFLNAVVFYFFRNFIKTHSQAIINCHNNSKLNQNLSHLDSITEYATSPVNICDSSEILVLAYVFISVKSIEKRSIIRRTWANKTLFKQLKVVFILGLSDNENLNKLVKTENEIHNDIIQSNFIDSYRNLSFKSITAWKWISENCKKAKFILKIDDDVMAHTFNLLKYINYINQENLVKTFYCNPWYNSPVIRDETSKFYVSYLEYDQEVFSTYCSGIAYIMTNDMFKDLYEHAKVSNIFWIDDIYVGNTAHCVKVFYKSIKNYYFALHDKYIIKSEKKFYLFIQDVEPISQFDYVWDLINKSRKDDLKISNNVRFYKNNFEKLVSRIF